MDELLKKVALMVAIMHIIVRKLDENDLATLTTPLMALFPNERLRYGSVEFMRAQIVRLAEKALQEYYHG